jgi:xanthine/uracil/vitamin C permease (AzgA family)
MSEENHERSGAAKLFDLRYLIGGLFTLYGVVLVIVGLTDSRTEINKAAGVHINLWTGLGMLILGLLFLFWARSRPLHPEPKTPAATETSTEDNAAGDSAPE